MRPMWNHLLLIVPVHVNEDIVVICASVREYRVSICGLQYVAHACAHALIVLVLAFSICRRNAASVADF